MIQTVVLATRNPGKVAEFRRILKVPNLTLLDLSAFPDAPEVAETADSYAGNALLKARAIASYCKLPALADDSGLEVDALGGAPGVKSARFAGEHAGFDIKLPKLLELMKAVPDEKRTARFRCALCLVDPRAPYAEAMHTEGCVEGRLVSQPQGMGGFGYDPVFVPASQHQTMAELSQDDKDRLSHRGQALRKMAAFIQRHPIP